MADNLAIKDGTGTSKTLAAKDVASVYYPRHIMVAGTGTEIDFNTYLTAENAYLASIDTHVDGLEGQMGGLTETAPASDTASSGLNGRLQRIAQRLTSLIALLPAALGQGTMAQSLRVVIASDQSALPISKSATIDDLADVTLNNGSETSLVGSDNTRREAIIVASVTNTVAIRIGKTGQVGAARGAALLPGQSIVLSTTAAIYGYAGAASQIVSITLLKD